MADGIHFPALPQSDNQQQQEGNTAVEQAMHMISERFTQLVELTEENLAELFEDQSVDSSPDDADLLLVYNGDGTFSAIEVGGLTDDPQPTFPLTPPVGRWTRLNARQSAEVLTGAATIALGSGATRLSPFMLSRPIASGTVTALRTAGAAISANVLMGIYATDTATGLPGALLFSGNNAASLAFTNLVPGVLYWAALGVLSTSVTWAALTPAESKAHFGSAGAETVDGAEANSFAITVASALPSPFSGAVTYAAADIPMFFLEDPS